MCGPTRRISLPDKLLSRGAAIPAPDQTEFERIRAAVQMRRSGYQDQSLPLLKPWFWGLGAEMLTF